MALVWIASDDEYNRADARRKAYIGRIYGERDFIPSDVHLERIELADLALPEDVSPATGAMEALERARAAWRKAYQQLSFEV
jgi:hypothetical protein